MPTSDLIYEYDGTEQGAPGPDYMQLLTDSVKTAVDDLDAAIAGVPTQTDSGWVPITTFGTGWSATAGNPPRVRRVGNRVDFVGSVTRAGTTGLTTDILTIPVGFRIGGAYSGNLMFGLGIANNATVYGLGVATATHKLLMTNNGGAITSGAIIAFNISWYVD